MYKDGENCPEIAKEGKIIYSSLVDRYRNEKGEELTPECFSMVLNVIFSTLTVFSFMHVRPDHIDDFLQSVLKSVKESFLASHQAHEGKKAPKK